MKLLVFAHTPPPHHGQSYMVQLMLDGLAGGSSPKCTVECLHVDARLSSDLEDIGRFRVGKIGSLAAYCFEAIGLRFRTGVRTLYYVPAPPRRVPLLRDCLTMALLRPWFPHLVLHWHAAGLGEWLATQPAWLGRLARLALGRADLSIVVAQANEADARKLAPLRTAVVPCGIVDPCPDFATRLLNIRRQRSNDITAALSRRGSGNEHIHVLFIALCTREKGLFDAAAGIAAANRDLAARGMDARFVLHVAGTFPIPEERAEFESLIDTPEWAGLVHCHGFVGGAQKQQLFEQADVLLFPTYYSAESFGVVIIEAMAFGLPVVTTRWRSIPEVLPPDYPGLVAPRDVAEITRALSDLAVSSLGPALRKRFTERFTHEHYTAALLDALVGVADRP